MIRRRLPRAGWSLTCIFAVAPHRIYSALNALGLYNKNAKILFLVS